MQYNGRLILPWPSIAARIATRLGGPQHLTLHARPQARSPSQGRCFCRSHRRCGFLGDADFKHLGGKHYFKVELPSGADRRNNTAWVQALDFCLPQHLRLPDSPFTSSDHVTDDVQTRRDVSLVLIEAQTQIKLDLIKHLGIKQQRWAAISWIASHIARARMPPDFWQGYGRERVQPIERAQRSLDSLIKDGPLEPEDVAPPRWSMPPLHEVTVDDDPRVYDVRLQNGALGKIWQGLGAMMIVAAERLSEAQDIMPHVLAILAMLHHHDIVPDTVYRYPPLPTGTVQQPPLLHMMSHRIMTALSEAAWRAREAAAQEQDKISDLKSTQISVGPLGILYYSPSRDLRPELWLELVLWSCLRGPWVEEGVALLNRISMSDHKGWSLLSWQHATGKSKATGTTQGTSGSRSAGKSFDGDSFDMPPHAGLGDNANVLMKVSSEVIAAYVDASISRVSVGVGERGLRLTQTIKFLQNMKSMLRRQNLGLGYATWATIVQRIMESGGLWLEKDPAKAVEVIMLAAPYAEGIGMLDPLPLGENGKIPYFFAPNSLPLGLLYRVLGAHARRGGVQGTFAAFKAFQDLTELTQRFAIEQFFRDLKFRPDRIGRAPANSFSFNSLAALDKSSSFPRLPVHTLALFLRVAVDIKEPGFAPWVLHSRDVNGPLIPSEYYLETGLAPDLVRFASVAKDDAVVEEVIRTQIAVSSRSQRHGEYLTATLVAVVIEVLIVQRDFESVKDMVGNLPKEQMRTISRDDKLMMPTMIREILRLEHESSDQLGAAKELHNYLALQMLRMKIWGQTFNSNVYSQLALLASVDKTWLAFVKPWFPTFLHTLPLEIGSPSFNMVLKAVLETRGVEAAKSFWETWCYDSAEMIRVRDHKFFAPRRKRLGARKLRGHVQVKGLDSVTFLGKVVPDLYSVRIILDGLETGTRRKSLTRTEETSKWLMEFLEALKTRRHRFMTDSELGAIEAALAELEEFAARKGTPRKHAPTA